MDLGGQVYLPHFSSLETDEQRVEVTYSMFPTIDNGPFWKFPHHFKTLLPVTQFG